MTIRIFSALALCLSLAGFGLFGPVQAHAATLPILSGINASTTDTTATITWMTDQSSTAQVGYGLTASYGSLSPTNNNQEMSHSVTLGGLTPDTTYHLQVISGTDAGNMFSGDMTFTTAATSTATTTTSTSTAPIATNGSMTVDQNSSATISLAANDTNSPALPLTFSIVSEPANGTLSGLNSASGTVTYTANSGFTGTDSFTFRVS